MSEIHYEEGRYKVEVVGACLGESKNGSPQIEIGLEILGYYEPHGGAYHEYSGPERTAYLSITDNTMGTPSKPGWVWKTLTDLGFVGPSLHDLAPLVGAVRDASMKIEEYEGNSSEKWNVWPRKGSSAARPVEQAKARQLDAKFAGLLRLAKGGRQAGNGHASRREEGEPTPPPTAPRPPLTPPGTPPAQAETPPARRPAPSRGRGVRVQDTQAEIPAGPAMSRQEIPF